MKKLIYALVVLFFMSVLFSSCGGGKKCPAYTKMDTKLEKNV